MKLLIPFVSLVLGLFVALVIVSLLGENPLHVSTVLVSGAFGSLTNFGYTLFYATPLILTGLCVSWAFKGGLFNIGAEGQMALGGVAMLWVGLLLKGLPFSVVILSSLAAGFVVGGFWGFIAGWLKAERGAHEVLCTILLNYIAYGLVSLVIAFPLRNIETQAPETVPLSSEYQLSQLYWLGGQSPLNAALIIALIIVFVFAVLLFKTKIGFKTRFVGDEPGTAIRTGIKVNRTIWGTMFISGGLAGVAGFSEIFGYALKLREGFTSGAGFLGIAVALLARNNPLGIVFSAILFGALQKGSLDLDLDTEYVTRDLAMVVQALVIIFVVSQKGLLKVVKRG